MDDSLVLVLIASRDDNLRSALASLLRKSGYAVLEATTGEECMRQALVPVRVVILEGSLVNMIAHFRAEPDLSELPVLVLGGEDVLGEMPHVRVLPRPVVPQNLLQTIKESLAQPSQVYRSSPNFFRGLLDGLKAHIAILDTSGLILAVNESWRNFARRNTPCQTPRSESDVLAPLCEGVNYLAACDSAIAPDEHEAKVFSAGLRDVLSGRHGSFSHEYPCHSATELRWFVARVRRVRIGGAWYVLVSHENITDRKRVLAELDSVNRRLADLLESIPEGFVLLNEEGKIVYANKIVERFLNQPRDAFLNQNFWKIVPELASLQSLKSFESGSLQGEIQLEQQLRAGACWAQVQLFPIREGCVVSLRDVSGLRQQREAQRQIQEDRVANLEKDLQQLQQLVSRKPTPEDHRPLREKMPDLFANWVAAYEQLLELSLEQRAYRVTNRISERLRLLSERMGYAQAGPRDVVEVHTQAVGTKTRTSSSGRTYSYIEESRLLLIELMGNLVSYYSRFAQRWECSSLPHGPLASSGDQSPREEGKI
jgi:PAS domain S-box-containing protein